MRDPIHESDSQQHVGGSIPGTARIHAYTLRERSPSVIPVMIAVPHAGRAYSTSLLKNLRNPQVTAMKLEDRHVDQLAQAIARVTGACLLVANAPRAMIDLNRAPDDIDWEMLTKAERPVEGEHRVSRRARSGLGLIPRRVPGVGEIWKQRHRFVDLQDRVAQIHVPYHEALGQVLSHLRKQWGTALLIDLHSMPPMRPLTGSEAPQFVVGDRFGATCHGSLVAAAFAHFNELGLHAAHNRPYAGGYVLERHAAPSAGVHAMQIEVDRSAYLDENCMELGPGFEKVAEILSGLVRRLACEIAQLGNADTPPRWQEAAE